MEIIGNHQGIPTLGGKILLRPRRPFPLGRPDRGDDRRFQVAHRAAIDESLDVPRNVNGVPENKIFKV